MASCNDCCWYSKESSNGWCTRLREHTEFDQLCPEHTYGLSDYSGKNCDNCCHYSADYKDGYCHEHGDDTSSTDVCHRWDPA